MKVAMCFLLIATLRAMRSTSAQNSRKANGLLLRHGSLNMNISTWGYPGRTMWFISGLILPQARSCSRGATAATCPSVTFMRETWHILNGVDVLPNGAARASIGRLLSVRRIMHCELVRTFTKNYWKSCHLRGRCEIRVPLDTFGRDEPC